MTKLRLDSLSEYEDKFTHNVRLALDVATRIAVSNGQAYVGTEPVLLAFMKIGCVGGEVLRKAGFTYDDLYDSYRNNEVIEETSEPKTEYKYIDCSPELEKAFYTAWRMESSWYGTGKIGTGILLMAIVARHTSLAAVSLNRKDYVAEMLFKYCAYANGSSPEQADRQYDIFQKKKQEWIDPSFHRNTKLIDEYTVDLTSPGVLESMGNCYIRKKEIQNIIRVMCRRTKFNPCLVGERGVGKTSIIIALADMILSGLVPPELADTHLLYLNTTSFVSSGRRYEGEFDDKLNKLIAELEQVKDVILVVDDLQTFFVSNGYQNASNAANVLKTKLCSGAIRMIGICSPNEYSRFIERNPVMERAFVPVRIEEPTVDETIVMLELMSSEYEKFHHVKIPKEAREACANLSARYINDRCLPDKAFDVMDTAAVNVAHLSDNTYRNNRKKILDFQATIDVTEKLVASFMPLEDYATIQHLLDGRATSLNSKEKIQKRIEKENTESYPVITEDDVRAAVSEMAGIPVERLKKDESTRLLKLESDIEKRVKGQKEAVNAVSAAIKRGRIGLKDPNRPIGSFLFLGPSGVGKTELSKTLAENIFGDESALIRFDMSEYLEKFDVSRLIGSPPGYVGYDEGGELTNRVRKKPYSVVLFDEVEKAHPDILDVLLQVLDDGYLTDAQGNRVSFKNTIIIMTSNAGADSFYAPKQLGFVGGNDMTSAYEDFKGDVNTKIKKVFKPEFLNRIDEIIVFKPLEKETVKEIVKLRLDDLVTRCKKQMGIERVTYSEKLAELILQKGFDPMFGARPIRRKVVELVENPLAEILLTQNGVRSIKLGVKNGEVSIVTAC